ncbi:MAG: hypothetical protein FVQ85_21405 [Planctomycetes bacterium]|nr:hypothetical protein [Planctomycetota bacterium]
MSLGILVNGDPEPDIYLGENETAVLYIQSPDGYSGPGDDVYFMLHVETAYGTASGGVVTPAAPDGSSIGPCGGDYCAQVIGPGSNGVWGAVMSFNGTPAAAGVYFDEITYLAGGAVGDAVISLVTTPDFMTFTQEDSVVIRQGPPPECMKTSAPEYAVWEAWGKPACWCYSRQCRGDTDGIKIGPFWVAIPDLNIFRSAFNKTDIVLANVANGICADFDHTKSGPFRVAIPDLNMLRINHGKIEALIPECDRTNYNFWETP